MSAASGTLSKVGIGSADPVTYMLDVKSEGLSLKEESINGNGVRGTRSHHIARVRAGLQKIEGPISFQPNAADLVQVLPWALCGSTAVVGGTNNWYKLGEAAVTRYVTIDRHAKVFKYASVGVDKITFKCNQGELLDCDLDLVAISETVAAAGTFPALQPDRTTNPFTLSDLSLSVNGTGSVTAKSFELSVSNKIDKERFFNSNTLQSIVAYDREVMFKATLPYGDWVSLYNLGAGTGVAVVATLTNGAVVLQFTMAKVVFPSISPNIGGRQEVMLQLEGRAYRDGATTDDTTQELITYLDDGF